ncbi:protein DETOXIFICATION [Trifolium repens]|nr:protein DETOXIFICATION [Trifolium repens]
MLFNSLISKNHRDRNGDFTGDQPSGLSLSYMDIVKRKTKDYGFKGWDLSKLRELGALVTSSEDFRKSYGSLEWWSYELIVLLSGLLPNPQLETSVLSVCLNTIATLYTIPFGIGAAASTRVSNELGAGNPFEARVAVLAAMSLSLMETTIVSSTLFACRHVYGYVFSNVKS